MQNAKRMELYENPKIFFYKILFCSSSFHSMKQSKTQH